MINHPVSDEQLLHMAEDDDLKKVSEVLFEHFKQADVDNLGMRSIQQILFPIILADFIIGINEL